MMPSRNLEVVIRKLMQDNDLSFRDFVEVALYHPQLGYYAGRTQPEADYVTSPRLSPVFGSALGSLVREFSSSRGAEMPTIVDVGCGDGSLIHSLHLECGSHAALRF